MPLFHPFPITASLCPTLFPFSSFPYFPTFSSSYLSFIFPLLLFPNPFIIVPCLPHSFYPYSTPFPLTKSLLLLHTSPILFFSPGTLLFPTFNLLSLPLSPCFPPSVFPHSSAPLPLYLPLSTWTLMEAGLALEGLQV